MYIIFCLAVLQFIIGHKTLIFIVISGNTYCREQLQGSEKGEGECTASAQREKRNHVEGMKK